MTCSEVNTTDVSQVWLDEVYARGDGYDLGVSLSFGGVCIACWREC